MSRELRFNSDAEVRRTAFRARPRKEVRLSIRISLRDREAIAARATEAGVSQAEYIIARCLDRPIDPALISDPDMRNAVTAIVCALQEGKP